jgi:hypothetical protein
MWTCVVRFGGQDFNTENTEVKTQRAAEEEGVGEEGSGDWAIGRRKGRRCLTDVYSSFGHLAL